MTPKDRRLALGLGLPTLTAKRRGDPETKYGTVKTQNPCVHKRSSALQKHMNLQDLDSALDYFTSKQTDIPSKHLKTAIEAIKKSKESELLETLENKNTRPTKAPEEWSKRDHAKLESPVDFIKRVYAPWIDNLQRADINRLDRPLYLALAQWMARKKSKNLLPSDLQFISEHSRVQVRPPLSKEAVREASRIAKQAYRQRVAARSGP